MSSGRESPTEAGRSPPSRLARRFEADLARGDCPRATRAGRPRQVPRPQEQRRRRRGCSSIATAPPDAEAQHRPLRQRAEAGHRGALDERTPRLVGTARPAGAVDVTLPGRAPARPPPSAHRRARSDGSHLHAHGLRHRRGPGDRGRVALLRRAQHAGRAPGARHAGHAVSGDAGRGRDRPARRSCARCCGRTPRRCRSATCRRTSRRSASSCRAASTAATIST